MTQDGDVYYINHKNKTTSWLDPRLDPRFGKGLPQNLCGHFDDSLRLGDLRKYISVKLHCLVVTNGCTPSFSLPCVFCLNLRDLGPKLHSCLGWVVNTIEATSHLL